MRFIDDLYALYKHKLTGNENESVMLVLDILADQKRDDLMKLIDDLSDNEVKQMVSLYLVELLKARMVKDGIMERDRDSYRSPYH